MTDKPNHDDLTEQERAALETAKFGITSASSRETANDLAAMAYDPNIQREMRAIAYEFKDTEMDGLTDDPQPEAGGDDMVTVSRKSNRKLLNKNLALVQENADLLAENERLRKALGEIQTLTLELTVQSRLSATEPGSKISNIALHALGLITDEEFEAAKGE